MFAFWKSALLSSLHFRIAFFVITTIVIIFGSYSAYQINMYQAKLIDAEMKSTEMLGRALTSSLEIAMANSDLEAIQRALQDALKTGDISQIFLMNNESEIRAASDKHLIGQTRTLSDQGCIECHENREGSLIPNAITLENDGLLRVVVPIVNKPECARCHAGGERYNGILVLDRSLEPIREELYSGIQRAIIMAAFSILVMMLLFRLYIKKQIINRVDHLESLARRVVNNELDLEIHLSGNDELSSLAQSFDNMKRSLRRSTEEIEGHRRYLDNLLNNLINGIIIVDDSDRIVFINKSVNDILEIPPPGAVPGDSIREHLYVRPALAGIEKLVTASRKSKVASLDILVIPLPDGARKHLEIHTGHLLLPPRQQPEVIIVIRDITTIIEYEKQMYKSEKLATVGRLAAGVAHEINNPMASILTCSEGLLKRGSANDETAVEYLNIIRNAARRCKMITQKLLGYSAATELKIEAVAPEKVVTEAISLLQFEATGKNVTLSFTNEQNLPAIKGSTDALVQVFVNLILNSIQAVDIGGKVDIDMKTENGALVVLITDNGSGIIDSNRDKIFEPFYTTKPIGIGTGLGLSVSQSIIVQHRGRIEILATRPGLTSIKVTIPGDKTRRGDSDD